MGDPLDLRAPGWLLRLLQAYLSTYDPDDAQAAVAQVQAERPDEPPELQGHRLALRRLEGVGLRPTRLAIHPALFDGIGADALARDDQEAIGLLVTQWDILQDIARLHRVERGVQSPLELLTVMALGLKDYPLGVSLHQAHEAELSGEPVPLARLAARVEAHLAPQGELRHGRAALSIGIGLAFIEARVLARIASHYYERAAIEEEGIRRLHDLSQAEKVDLLEVLVHMAWADGKIAPEERRLIGRQIELAQLEKGTSARLRRALDVRPEGAPTLRPLEDASTRRFILEQAILLSLVDDEQAEDELRLLAEVSRQLGGEALELEAVMVEVAAWYERNREMIRELGPVSGSLGRLRRLVMTRAQDAVRSNMRKLVQEIRETGELAKLLGAASVRELTPDEGAKVRSQLLDICKTVPALAIFLLPGGGLLLPVLIKLLPFNILPTAFGDQPSPAVAPSEPA